MSSNMQDVAALFKEQMKNVERARAMASKKPTVRVPKQMLVSIHEQGLLRWKEVGNGTMMCNSIITLTYPPCPEPLSSLRRVPLTDLLLETVHRGKYVLVKILTEPDKAVGVRTVVEDPEGNADILSLYNYAVDRQPIDALPIGMIIAVKEPYYKMSAGGGATLRCDHPQNVVELSIDDPLVQQLTWKSGTPSSIADSRQTLSFDECRLKGNDYFKQGQFYEAIATYTRGLTTVSSDSNLMILKLNRAAASLKLERYEAALDDCRHVLELNTNNEKALYRAAKAFYGLNEFESALVKMQLYAKVTANQTDALQELRRIEERLKEEQRGVYDWNAMQAEAKKSTTPRLDHASYVGPVRIVNISNERGRGLVLTRDVRQGELLLCSKAFHVCYPIEAGVVTYINMETKLSDQGAQELLAQKIVHKLVNNPSLAKRFFDLYAGKHRLARIPPSVIDAFWVGDICTMNAFGITDDDLNPREDPKRAFRYEHLTDNPSGLYLLPSYINHACLGNCDRSFIGDMMIVRALTDLPAGTELMMTYVDLFWDFDERQSALAKHEFVCNCALCELDKAERKDVRQHRIAAVKMYASTMTATIEEAERIIRTIEQTFEESKRDRLQVTLCIPLLDLAKKYLAKGKTQESINACMKIMKIHAFGSSESIWTAALLPAMQHLCLSYFASGQTDMGRLWLDKLRAALSITAAGDDRVFVEEHGHTFERLGVKLS